MGDLLIRASLLTRDTAEDTVEATQLSRSELCSRRIPEKVPPVTGAEAKVTWPETAQQDGPMGRVPGDRAKICDASGAIRSESECR